jgi:geranylgeranyl diphosphate synthase, type II
MEFRQQLGDWVEIINSALDVYVFEKDSLERTIYRAMRYSLTAGGKRLRPVLALAVCDIFEGDINEVMPYACAIEMIHTYSLIHDDLPAMDNDDYRRGRLTNHKVFGDAIAILAGDALLNYAFEIMLNFSLENIGAAQNKMKAMQIIAKASGVSGMIGGQVVDIEAEGKIISGSELQYMHKCKTGALIKAPVMASAVLNNATKSESDALEVFSENLGLAFQIKDDILDVEGNSDVMGKPAGSDAENKKSTFVTLYGLNESKKLLKDTTNIAINSLDIFGEKAGFLKKLSEYLLVRDN